ncbi:hypothetical protein [uncultured Draconibacterium sp.]|uniref:hypothetical protein n=1 Tax=uncultured Draconibacterium sp. TaxID=1573823 RepID=UPI0029C76536|nr:hypothetical protein [uncultured Draconibacterium sp.]
MKIKSEGKVSKQNVKRLQLIAANLRAMRHSDGRLQDGYIEEGLTRRQIQYAESSSNLTLIKLFEILDCYGYKMKDLVEID